MKIKSLLLSLSFLSISACMHADFYSGLYTGITGGYFKTGDFNSAGGGLHLGYSCPTACWDLKQGFEVEILGIFGEKRKLESIATSVPDQTQTTQRKISLMQLPVFLNYRIGSDFCQLPCLSWHAGSGLGFIWVEAKNHKTFNQDLNGNPVTSTFIPTKDNSIDFAGQIFAGLGYKLTECLTLDLDIRLILAKRHTWNDVLNAGYPTSSIQTASAQLGLGIGLSYGW